MELKKSALMLESSRHIQSILLEDDYVLNVKPSRLSVIIVLQELFEIHSTQIGDRRLLNPIR